MITKTYPDRYVVCNKCFMKQFSSEAKSHEGRAEYFLVDPKVSFSLLLTLRKERLMKWKQTVYGLLTAITSAGAMLWAYDKFVHILIFTHERHFYGGDRNTILKLQLVLLVFNASPTLSFKEISKLSRTLLTFNLNVAFRLYDIYIYITRCFLETLIML